MPFPPILPRTATYGSVLVRYFISPYCLHSPHTPGSSKMDFLACNTVLKYLLTDKIKHLDKKHEYLQIIQEIPIWFAKTSVHVP